MARAVLAGAVVLAAVVPVLLAAVSGSLAIPHNDAWSYSRIAQHFAGTGELRLLGWNRSSLVGQLVVLGPLGSSIVAQHLFVALLAGVAVLACYDLLLPHTGPRRAAFGALVLAAWPELGMLSASFMSDVPTLVAVLGCLTLAQRAFAASSVRLFAASLLVGLWGVTIREQAVAAPAAVLAFAAWRAWQLKGFRLGPVLGSGAAFGALVVAFELWRRSLPGDDPPNPPPTGPVLPAVLDLTLRGYFLLALAVSPALVLVARPWRWRPGSWLAAAAAAGVAGLVWHDYRLAGFSMSDALHPRGPWPTVMLGDRTMFGPPVLAVIVVLSTVAGALLAGLLASGEARLPALIGCFTVLTVAGTLATRAAGQDVFGRYLIPLIPVLLLVPLPLERPRASRAGAVAVIAVLAGLSVAATAFGFALDAARWRTGERLTAAGTPPTDIDAGFEWTGYHSPRGAERGAYTYPWINFYNPIMSANRPCLVLSSSPQQRDGWRLLRTTTYRSFIVTGTGRIWVYDTGYCP